jgi:hypothetical protein
MLRQHLASTEHLQEDPRTLLIYMHSSPRAATAIRRANAALDMIELHASLDATLIRRLEWSAIPPVNFRYMHQVGLKKLEDHMPTFKRRLGIHHSVDIEASLHLDDVVELKHSATVANITRNRFDHYLGHAIG